MSHLIWLFGGIEEIDPQPAPDFQFKMEHEKMLTWEKKNKNKDKAQKVWTQSEISEEPEKVKTAIKSC